MSIDDERAAFMRDLLLVLTSLYSWAGAVVHGQTEDGHDVVELADGTRVWTEARKNRLRIVVFSRRPKGGTNHTIIMWDTYITPLIRMSETARIATGDVAESRIRDLLSGPP